MADSVQEVTDLALDPKTASAHGQHHSRQSACKTRFGNRFVQRVFSLMNLSLHRCGRTIDPFAENCGLAYRFTKRDLGMSVGGNNEKIEFLIVDDEKLIHGLVIRMLRSYGLKNFYSVYNPHNALRIIRRQKVEFVITDWIMPLMTGIELIRVIRGDPKLFDIPILVLSGVSTVEGVSCAIEEGADGYLIKPFTAVNLMKAIRNIEYSRIDPLQLRIIEMTRLKLQHKYREAVKLGTEILEEKEDANVLFLLGECLGKLKEYPDAIDMLNKSADEENCGKSNNLLGKIYMEQGDRKQGISHLKLASEQCSLNLSRKVDLAEAYFKTGLTSEAEAVVDAVMKSSPTNLIVTDLGKLYLEQEDLGKAQQFLGNAAIPTPDTIHIFNNYAIFLRRRGLYNESEIIYKKCIELAPDSFALYFNAGIVCKKNRDYVQAKVMFEQTLRLNPNYEPAMVYLDSVKSKICILPS